MTPELKARWVEALRSGEYKQGKGALKGQDHCGTMRYCCLGVLAEVAGMRGIRDHEWGDDTKFVATYRFGGSSAMLSSDHLASMRLAEPTAVRLAQMNDGGDSFDKIADKIEADL